MPLRHAIIIFFVVFTRNVHEIKIGELLVFMLNPHNLHKDKSLKHSGQIINSNSIPENHEILQGEVPRMSS